MNKLASFLQRLDLGGMEMNREDEVYAVIETNGCIYELIQGPTNHEYKTQLYDALAKAIYESRLNKPY
jgi:hypothetical protein